MESNSNQGLESKWLWSFKLLSVSAPSGTHTCWNGNKGQAGNMVFFVFCVCVCVFFFKGSLEVRVQRGFSCTAWGLRQMEHSTLWTRVSAAQKVQGSWRAPGEHYSIWSWDAYLDCSPHRNAFFWFCFLAGILEDSVSDICEISLTCNALKLQCICQSI